MATKWIGKARKSMEKRGTEGSLRAAAQSKGMLSGKSDTLSTEDLDRLAAIAKKTKNTKLARKVAFARNVRK